MTIRMYLEDAVAQAPTMPFQRFFSDGEWVTRNYAEFKKRVIRVASIIKKLDLQPGKHNVALMLENSPEWQEIYIALAGSGLAVVPLDPKLRANEVAHILKDSQAIAIFAGSKLEDVLREAFTTLPAMKSCVWVHGAEDKPVATLPDCATYRYETLLAKADDALEAAREWYEAHRPTEDMIASIIYTSGTTGKPKGAMLTHGNFTSNVAGTLERVPFYSSDNYLNVLPLFHAFSFVANFMLPLATHACTSFVRSLRTISDDMLHLQPTILLAVPLMAEKLYARVSDRLRKNMIARGMLGFNFTKNIVSRKIIEGFGGKLRLLGIGGAPTSRETLLGFQEVGIPVLEGYGITECSPGVAYPHMESYVVGTVGPVLDNMQYKLVDCDESGAGELCVKGPNVMKGYYNNPEATAESFDDEGYFHTGDLVRLDAAKNVSICGRKKAMIVNREGKNIYPEEIEQALEHAPLIQDVIVVGYHVGTESGERIGAIIVPNEDAIKAHLKGKILTHEEMSAFITDYAQGVCRASVADYKMPRKFEVRYEPLMRTSTMKVRRVVYNGALDE